MVASLFVECCESRDGRFADLNPNGRSYDVRFLMIEREETRGAKREPANIVLVRNWLEEFKRRAPPTK